MFSINICIDSAYMFLCGCFRMKNSDLKVFEEAGFNHVDLIVCAKDKFDDGSRT